MSEELARLLDVDAASEDTIEQIREVRNEYSDSDLTKEELKNRIESAREENTHREVESWDEFWSEIEDSP